MRPSAFFAGSSAQVFPACDKSGNIDVTAARSSPWRQLIRTSWKGPLMCGPGPRPADLTAIQVNAAQLGGMHCLYPPIACFSRVDFPHRTGPAGPCYGAIERAHDEIEAG